MKQTLLLLLLAFTGFVNAQEIIDWENHHQLELSDFQSPTTKIGGGNIYSVQTGSGFDFYFDMVRAEFTFTKNFNSKVNCTFKPSLASLIAPDTAMALELLDFARYAFDLSELYARKFRQKMYEQKGAFSSAAFYKPLYDQIQQEYMERYTRAADETEIGRSKEKLKELHDVVLTEIEMLSDFCKTCKPPRKGR